MTQDHTATNNARRSNARLHAIAGLRDNLDTTRVRLANAQARPHDHLMIAKLPGLQRQLIEDTAKLAEATARHEAILESEAKPAESPEAIAERAAANRAVEQARWKAANDAKAGR
jgi:hypothetical protein